jgi:acetyl esterase/lipase
MALNSLRIFAGVALIVAALTAAEIPPPRPVPVQAQNTVANGPAIPATPPVESSHPTAVLLWPEGAPGFESRKGEPENIGWRQESDIVFPIISNIHNPTITPFLPAKAKSTGCAVIIAPGGGHMFHTIDREGYDLARWLADHGVAAFVLKYRLMRDQSNPAGTPQPYKAEVHALADANRAIRLIRSRAAEWNVKPDRVGILGFSAGGEVAILAAVRNDAGKGDAADPIERLSSRPDFFAPIYPGGLGSHDGEVTKEKTPPAFLACAYDDRMPEQLTAFFNTLRKAGVNAELHIYNSGGHGFGVRPRPLAVTGWPQRFLEWLGDRGMLR